MKRSYIPYQRDLFVTSGVDDYGITDSVIQVGGEWGFRDSKGLWHGGYESKLEAEAHALMYVDAASRLPNQDT